MSLREYNKKRTFKTTPEPKGGKPTADALRFVVQQHKASRLHYDFRLEMGGVLKSWAVPKGPSLNPSVKRLAIQVEDHPFSYRSFEGTIPKGNYGAGNVIVWDEGTYDPVGVNGKSKSKIDKQLRGELENGKIKFSLAGKKLKGDFALVKTSARGDNAWLLMKIKDEYATTQDILEKDKSVVSGKKVTNITNAELGAKPSKQTARKKSGKKSVDNTRSPSSLLKESKKSDFYESVTPMLATLVDEPFHKPGWLYEIKWDGYRAVAFKNGNHCELMSRNHKSFSKKFYPVYEAICNWKMNAIVDGEIVALNEKGRPDFGRLQNWRSEADGPLLYYLFDVLWVEGKDVTNLPLHKRKEILKRILPEHDILRMSEAFETDGNEFYATIKKMGIEGMMAKKADSKYEKGQRTREWLKIKTGKRHEVVIGGYTINENTSKRFSALLVGVYERNELVYTGKIGTGFTDVQQKEMIKLFEPLMTDKIPFATTPDYNKPSRFNPRPLHAEVIWLKPELVCEVNYTEETNDGIMRHPSFQGMRTDKKAKDVKREVPADTAELTGGEAIANLLSPGQRERGTLLNPSEKTQVKKVNGHSIKFTNLDKIYWPKQRITKRNMLNYYYQIAPYLLPYLKDRPQSLNRFPNGIDGKSFYQKDVTGKVPGWVKKYRYHSSDEPEVDKHFWVPSEEADILLMASLGSIEMNPWSSRVQKPDHPDWCVIDLDPDKNSFEQVIEVARVTHELLDALKIPNYCKTSGSTGIHIYIPLGALYTYEQSKEFARAIVTQVNKEMPKTTSIERSISDRKGKIYLDFLQNRPQATLAAPYSLRPKPGAPVSMPLHWEEVKKGLKIIDFNISNAFERTREIGDIFEPVLGKGVELKD